MVARSGKLAMNWQCWPNRRPERPNDKGVVRRTRSMFAKHLWQSGAMEDANFARLGKYVKERREELGLSQEDVARLGGPSTTTLSKIENGASKRIRRRTAQDLERVLGWRSGDVEYVLYGGFAPRVAKAPIGRSETRDLHMMDRPGEGDVEGSSVYLSTDASGRKVFVGSSYWVDGEGRPWRYEVRFWPASDVGAYTTDFSMVLGDLGSSIREHMSIVRDVSTRSSESEGPLGMQEGRVVEPDVSEPPVGLRVVSDVEIAEAVERGVAAKTDPNWENETDQ